jgi:hypothetical protein
VTRALARARTYRPVPKAQDTVPTQLSPEEERLAAADLQDPTKARSAVRKLMGADNLESEIKKAQEARIKADIAQAQFIFVSRHVNDYYRCEANSRVLVDYIRENELDPTNMDNYEVAFNAVQDKLAQRPAPPVTPTPEPQEPPKRQAAGGIQPGELSGHRQIQRTPKGPMTKDGPLTVEDIKRMRNTEEGRAEWKKRVRTDPSFYPAVNALLAKR